MIVLWRYSLWYWLGQFNITLFDEEEQIFIEQIAIEGTIGESPSMILEYKSKAINIAPMLQDFIYFIY